MNQILNTTEILGTIVLPEGECELLASAAADFAERSKKLVVRLDASIRQKGATEKQEPVKVDWLPRSQTITEMVSIEEAGEVARDIFGSWVRKVRAAAPSIHQPSF